MTQPFPILVSSDVVDDLEPGLDVITSPTPDSEEQFSIKVIF